jgi:hypothetical protein
MEAWILRQNILILILSRLISLARRRWLFIIIQTALFISSWIFVIRGRLNSIRNCRIRLISRSSLILAKEW